ncbi:MAG TPA: hypothetical protein VGO58_17285 [Chitinophagaceae bacterium]|jgi:hypothetical protein|nr:hypothetical protein [Chitinophagaceae bacterium]
MKAILLLAVVHILIMHQSRKKNSQGKEVLPAPSSAPVIKQSGPGKQVHPEVLSVFYYVGKSRFAANSPVTGF